MAFSGDRTENTVIIGIDFGTTFSGVAFTWSKKIDHIEVISNWESVMHSNFNEDKAPTAISFGPKKEVKWGYNIPAADEQAKWFKLLLLDDNDLPEEVRDSVKIKDARAYLEKHNITTLEAITIFLRHLWNHAIQHIMKSVSRNLVNYSKFHIVVTLPAIWPAYARGRMREAAKQAGMLAQRLAGETELTFIAEPEAAALATLADMKDRCDIKVRWRYLRGCCCGGGTADLISYQVVSLSPMAVKECVKGQGGLCGAVFVDEAFTEILKRVFGSDKWANMSAESQHRFLHDEWEDGIKPTFDGGPRTWKLAFPFECLDLNSLKMGGPIPKFTLTDQDVSGAFDPVVSKIREMVDDQMAAVKENTGKRPKYVILVGGFGRCRYLFSTLNERFGHEVEVLQAGGSKPWTAVCRGAVIHAASLNSLSAWPIQIQARISRVNCGMVLDMLWDPAKHEQVDKYWDDDWQCWKAKDQMCWHLKIGDNMSAVDPVKIQFGRVIALEDAGRKRFTDILYTCTTPNPPKRFDATMKRLGEIRWEAEIDTSTLPIFTNRLGKVFHTVDCEAEMTCTGGSVDFAIYHGGKRQGSKSVVVDFETN